MSRQVVPVATSCHSHIDIIVAMAVPTKRPCGAVSSSGTSMDMCGELPPCRDLAISTKLGGGFHCCVLGLPKGVFTLWLETVDKLSTGLVVVALAIPYCRSPKKNPGGRPFCSCFASILGRWQVPLAQKFLIRLSSPSVMMHHCGELFHL